MLLQDMILSTIVSHSIKNLSWFYTPQFCLFKFCLSRFCSFWPSKSTTIQFARNSPANGSI